MKLESRDWLIVWTGGIHHPYGYGGILGRDPTDGFCLREKDWVFGPKPKLQMKKEKDQNA